MALQTKPTDAARPAHEHEPAANADWAKSIAVSGPYRLARWGIALVDLKAATGLESAVWEEFQLQYLCRVDRGATGQALIASSKTRQCGFSWLLALEAVARSAVYPGSLTNIVSINRDEAEEKIRYARQISEAVRDPAYRLEWEIDNRGDLQATNGSRIRSHACRPPRGRPGAHHRLDEVAHYQRPQEVYDAAVAGTLRAGSITCCSSPWVRGGFHYSVMEEPSQYPDFERLWVPWWHVFGLCTNVAAAKDEAPHLTTWERVEAFGSPRLQRLFRNMPLEAFQVECELSYADDSLAWLTWEEIISCTSDETVPFVVAEGLDEARRELTKLLAQGRAGPVYAGYDVARKRDLAVLTLFEQTGDTLVCFAVLLLPDCRFQDQKALLQQATPLLRGGCIDETGLGMNLAEDMRAHSTKWSGIAFTAPMKAQLAGDLRELFQTKTIQIPPDRELQRDLHSVQRLVTAANNIVYNADREEGDGHADRFWSLALGVHASVRATGRVVFRAAHPGPQLPPDLLHDLRVAQGLPTQTVRRRKREDEPVVTDQCGRPVKMRRGRPVGLL